ncbi:Paired domain-containing protein [Aphelenchoides besseyi]|nr:Paired domain-containing protein [Aphelenchoides besseyi]KAI6200387.1 Paired domain-containing protein [Aphelenchoides besseyi]
MNVNALGSSILNLNEWCQFYGALNQKNSLVASELVNCGPTVSASSYQLPLDTIGESARNRFGRPYISGRPLLACDRRKIIELYAKGARKITIARAIGVTHSCVSKVIRRFEETGDFDNRGSRTASCACPGEAENHDPSICRHVKFRQEQNPIELPPQRIQRAKTDGLKLFSVDWILSDKCQPKREIANHHFAMPMLPVGPALNRLV